MRKVFLLLTAMLLSGGMWALDNVPYVDMVVSTDAQGNVTVTPVAMTANNVTEITNTTTTLNAGWYVVNGTDVKTTNLTCNGDVHLILADGAKLTATGGETSAAGVQVRKYYATLAIYGQSNQSGQLIAKGGSQSAGIGGVFNDYNGAITINGGVISASGATGIGAGDLKRGANITINGGVVTATGGRNGAGIGGGSSGSAENIVINGGKVHATGFRGIGSGFNGAASKNIFVAENLYLRSDDTNPSITLIPHVATDDVSELLRSHVSVSPTLHLLDIKYIDADGKTETADALLVTDATEPITWEADWYVVLGDITLAKGAVCNGDVHLILADGATLTARGVNVAPSYTPGIQVSGANKSLTMYAQSAQTGQLVAYGGYQAAGIGGGPNQNGSNVTVYGGIVNANGGVDASGIGGGKSGNGSNIYVYGGTVAASGPLASGIGGGNGGSGSNIHADFFRSVTVGDTNPPTEDVEHTLAEDISPKLAGKGYVKIEKAAYRYNVPYVDGNGDVQKANKATFIYESKSQRETWEAGWYVIYGEVSYGKGIICQGDVRLILQDGAVLTATGEDWKAGIGVSGAGNTLTIYGQSAQTGRLHATGGTNAAGIGGDFGTTGSNITINSGVVVATGGQRGAGIGSGHDAPDTEITRGITINGGVVTATGGGNGAGIGGGSFVSRYNPRKVADIAINGGIVTAIGGGDYFDGASGIGGGTYGGGDVHLCGSASNIKVNTRSILKADRNQNPPTTIINHDSRTDIASQINGIRYVSIVSAPYDIAYVDENGTLRHVTNPTEVIASSERETWESGWYVVLDDITLAKGAVCNGDVHLILADGATLTATGGQDAGINVSHDFSFTVYGQSEQTGKLIAHGGNSSAGIGGNYRENGMRIFINGGDVEATGGRGGAGIGGGLDGSGIRIVINRGTVTASGGGQYCDGIGKGQRGVYAVNMRVSASVPLLAGSSAEPTTFIPHTTNEDIASQLTGNQYVSTIPRLQTHYAADKDGYYTTFYYGNIDFEVVTEGVTLYTASMETVGGETSLSLHKIEGYILPAGTAVVVRSENEGKVRLAPYIGSTEGIDVSGNVLRGVDVATAKSELPGSLYVLSAQVLSGDEVATTAFYRYTGETMAPHKAFLQLAPGAPAPTRIVWGNRPVPTEIENVSRNDNGNADKVLRDGVLYIIKGARVYNAQGVLVE